MIARSALLPLAIAASLAGAGCLPVPPTGAPEADVTFETGVIRFLSSTDTFVLRVDIAETSRQRRIGLSRRSRLAEEEGMLFLFEAEQPAGAAFWMYRTSIPLSIALLDSARVIREIRDMEPCRSWISLFCRRYTSSVPFHAAIEVNQGYFERRGLGVGDRAVVQPEAR